MVDILVIAAIGLVFSLITKNAKKANENAGQQRQRVYMGPDGNGRKSDKVFSCDLDSMLEAAQARLEGDEDVDEESYAHGSLGAYNMGAGNEGSGLRDDAGCIGGSMVHDSHEGLSNADASILRIQQDRERREESAAEGDRIKPMRSASTRARLTREDMRKAVITSEVLGAPLALRRD